MAKDSLQAKRTALSRRLSGCKDLIRGSLVINRRRCGTPGCRCSRGELHESLALTYKEGGKSYLVHIPEHLERQARKANRDYRRLKEVVGKLSEANVEILKSKARMQRLHGRRKER